MIERGRVHIWRAALDRVEVVTDVLDDEERERAARFLSEEARWRFLNAHAALRRILTNYAGEALAGGEPVRFGRSDLGKPYLAGSAVRFSMSHSGGLAVFAVTIEDEIGVDVEQIRGNIDAVVIARRFLPPAEAAAVEADPPSFFRFWTRREAYLKALGVGIRGLSLPFAPEFTIADVDAGPGYVAAVACAPPCKVTVFDYPAVS